MNETSNRLRVAIGFFVLASLIALAVLITLFGGFPSYLRPAETYTIIFDNAQGVAPGTPVLRSGVRIGEVRSVQLDNETGKVRVVIAIDEGYTLRKGDRATLTRNLLGGDTSIAFVPPDDPRKVDATSVEPGAELPGSRAPDASRLLEKTANLVVPAQETLDEMRKFVAQMNRMTPLMEQTLTEYRELGKTGNKIAPKIGESNEELRELIRSARQAVPELRKTNDAIRTLAQNTNAAVPELRKTNALVQDLLRTAQKMAPELERTNEEARQAIRTWGRVGERASVLLQANEEKITKSLEQLQRALTQANELLSKDNINDVRAIVKNSRLASERFESIARGADEALRDSRLALNQLTQTMRRLDTVLIDLQKATVPFGERSPGILKNLDESAAQLKSTLADFRDLMRVAARSDGTVQRLLGDPALYNNINDAACMVKHLMPRIDRALRDVEIFADRIARHPELLGVRGAIRPGSGLKEAPSSVFPWGPLPHP